MKGDLSGNTVRIRTRVKNWLRNERGLSDAATMILFLPFVAFILFALVEASVNINMRARINSVTQDVATRIAKDGGVYWERTSPATLNPETGWVGYGETQLEKLCGPSNARCTEPPTITCEVANALPTQPGMIQVGNTAGSAVECTSEFHYKPVSPLSRNPETSLGLSGMFTNTIKSTTYSTTVVGPND